MENNIHPFEKAGLGKYPYTMVGSREKWHVIGGGGLFPHKQPASCCDYCATGIAYEYWLRSADGKEFKVGSDCICKLDMDLAKSVKQIEKERKQAQLANAVDAAREVYRTQLFQETAAAMPHPKGFSGKSFLDYVDFMMVNAGSAARLKIAKQILKIGETQV